MGAWIEIRRREKDECCLAVAPYMGAWIEIFQIRFQVTLSHLVAPYMGAWIEITV